MDIKNMDFTEQDFQLLVDGLDALPEKGSAGEMLGDLFIGMLEKDNPEAIAKAKIEREERKRIADQKKRQQLEDIRILQGKLFMLKRWMATQGAIRAVDDIINPMG